MKQIKMFLVTHPNNIEDVNKFLAELHNEKHVSDDDIEIQTSARFPHQQTNGYIIVTVSYIERR